MPLIRWTIDRLCPLLGGRRMNYFPQERFPVGPIALSLSGGGRREGVGGRAKIVCDGGECVGERCVAGCGYSQKLHRASRLPKRRFGSISARENEENLLNPGSKEAHLPVVVASRLALVAGATARRSCPSIASTLREENVREFQWQHKVG